jgi:hypothetical protein
MFKEMGTTMHHNYKLKRAVAIALSLITLASQGNALALGLSDIEVKSHLGQPLKAKINVFGASEIKDASCFKLDTSDGNSHQLSHASFKLGPVVNDEATLTLTTAQVVNEPILNLAVVADCGSSVRRDYVLLIDPLLTAEIENTDDEVLSTITNESKVSTEKAVASSSQKQTIIATEKKAKKGKKKQKNKTLKNNNPDIVLHVLGGSEENSLNSAEKNIATQSKPRLSISGGNQADVPLGAANLRMDKQLTFTPDANAESIAEDVAMQDEVTAMNNRLMNLEKQITKLQQENLKLKSENSLKTQEIASANSFKDKASSLLPVFGGGLLLVGGYYAVSWWRRRQLKLQAESTEAIWSDLENENLASEEFDTTEEDNLFADIAPRQSQSTAAEKSAAMEESFESTQIVEEPILVEEAHQGLAVLDHADVFLSHGRTSLAIQLLQNHLLDHPKQSVTIWLFLLDLLAKENLQEFYEQVAMECKEHFNIKISEFAKGDKSANHNLESFPHLAEGLQQAWNTSACIVYLDDLIYNNRLEPRAGLDKNLIEELLLLKSIAQENLNTAEVIQLDEKKLAIKEQKEAIIAAKKAEKLEQMNEAVIAEQNKAKVGEKLYEFSLVEWK